MAAEHAGHDHAHGLTTGKLRTAFLLTAVILVVELAGGLVSHSLALLSDAGHVLTDIFALGLAWFATAQAERPADAKNTYGYHHTGILAALANAVTLILVVLAIAYEAVRRFRHPEAVTPWLMFVSAAVGIAVNLYIGFGLQTEGGDNLNVRAAMLRVFGGGAQPPPPDHVQDRAFDHPDRVRRLHPQSLVLHDGPRGRGRARPHARRA